MEGMKMKELGIYVHIPFCKQKCYYCDFVSYANKETEMKRYFEALQKEIEVEKEEIDRVTTIYIGGGTPSMVDKEEIQKIVTTIKQNYRVEKEAEITIEVNPGTVDEEKLKSYKEVGINRLSIGLQSTKNELLKKIGRIHTYEEFLACYQLARKVGFKNINIDLMLGLPNQTLKDVEESIEKVIKLNPEHISIYSLIIEENTLIEKMLEEKILTLPKEEIERRMYWQVKRRLERTGYIHYEISNFAKQGYESKHNTNCWKQKEYLGFGVSAHSYRNKERYCNTSAITEYCKNSEEGKMKNNRTICEIQTEEERRKEYMLLGLRMLQGIDVQEFKHQFIQNPLYLFHQELEKLVKEELIEVELNQIKLTNKGLDFANLVWEEFV